MFEKKKHELLRELSGTFNQLGYSQSKPNLWDYSIFLRKAIFSLNHCQTLSDTLECLEAIRTVNFNWEKGQKYALSNPLLWRNLKAEKSKLHLVSDEEALGVYTITNALSNPTEILLASQSFEEEAFAIKKNLGKYQIYDDSNYSLKHSATNKGKMNIFLKGVKCCSILLNDDLSIQLIKNQSSIVLNYDRHRSIYWIYSRKTSALERVPDNAIAAFESSILSDSKYQGVSKVEIYTEDAPEDLIFLLAISAFLVVKSHMDDLKQREGILIGMICLPYFNSFSPWKKK